MTQPFSTPPAAPAADVQPPSARRWALALGTFCFAWYAFHAAPTSYLLDSAELTATTVGLGISHPPGHPAFHLLAWPALLLPIGTLPFRIHLACALFTALSVAILPIWAQRLDLFRTRAEAVLVAGAALTAGLSQAWLFQSIRAEVYSLNLLCTLLALSAVLRTDRRPAPADWVLAAAALGCGLLNHHYLTVFTFPGVALALAWPRATQAPIRALGAAALTGALAVTGYAYLFARGLAQAWPAWVWPTDPERALWLISAKAFQKTAGRALEMDPVAGITNAVTLLADSLTWPGLVLAAVGAALWMRTPRLGVPLVVVGALNLVTQILFDFDPFNPDVLGYFMPAFGIAAVCMATALVEAHRRSGALRPARPALLIAAVLPVIVGLVMPSAPARTRSLRGWHDIDLFTTPWLDLPPNGLAVTSYFETGFMLWHAQTIGDERPDVIHLHRSWRTYPYYDAMMLERHPSLGGLFAAPAQTAELSPLSLHAWAGRSEVHLEVELLSTPAERTLGTPVGLFWDLSGAATRDPFDPVAFRAAIDRVRAGAHVPLDIQTQRNLAWTLYQTARWACTDAQPACEPIRDMALELAPGDPALLELAPGSAPAH